MIKNLFEYCRHKKHKKRKREHSEERPGASEGGGGSKVDKVDTAKHGGYNESKVTQRLQRIPVMPHHPIFWFVVLVSLCIENVTIIVSKFREHALD